MAEDLIKIKDFPIIDEYENINAEDRVVATHVSGSSRQTVAITVNALGQKIVNDAPNSIAIPRNYFGYDDPTSSEGKNGDMYFKLMSGTADKVITSTFVKINGQWISFQVTDDNWRKFLEGQGFDVISYDATSVKAHAFENNQMINNVIMPNVINIYEYAFASSSIKTMSFPKCTYIGDYAFKDCSAIRNGSQISLPAIDTIGAHAFDGFGGSSNRATMDITNVRVIQNHAFYTPGNLWNNMVDGVLDLPNCENIGDHAFASYGDTGNLRIQKVNLPAIKTIGEQAFRYIQGPNNFEMHIGPNCEFIGSQIFYWVQIPNNKGSIYVEALTPPVLDFPFYGDTSGPLWYPEHIYVPYPSVQAYKEASNWSYYASLIEAIPEEE